jgi:pimeloyl-ACP methyl ester carboxylesterase
MPLRLRHPLLSRLAAVALAVVIAAALTGCAMFPRLDMAAIHQGSASRPQRNPIILIHGFLGSKLQDARTHESVWGGVMNAIKRGRSDDLSLPIDSLDLARDRDDLVPYALVESVVGLKFYTTLLESLRDVGGYRQGDIENPKPGDTLFIYDYDWRRDNVESAIGLGHAIERIKNRLHAPDMRFDIVAHSMGGLVAQYYLGFGTQDVIGLSGPCMATWAGAPDIGRLILIGTPLQGTMSALRILNTGFSRSMSPEVVFTMPSLYQLLPSDGQTHIIDPRGNAVDVDLYDAREWVRNRWSVFGSRTSDPDPAVSEGNPAEDPPRRFLQAALDRARAFHEALAAAAVDRSPIPIHLFGSDCIPTLDRAILKPTSSGPVLLFDGESAPDARQLEKQMLVPGDGTVTTGSLLARGAGGYGAADRDTGSRTFASTFFFCETHGLLPADRGFQDNLLYVLFESPQRPAPLARASRGD